jgi:hypothetical protein
MYSHPGLITWDRVSVGLVTLFALIRCWEQSGIAWFYKTSVGDENHLYYIDHEP